MGSFGVVLSASNHLQLWVPPSFAHGFMVTSDSAKFLYKTTDYWYPEFERSLLWSDPTVGVQWLFEGLPQLAAKDVAGKLLGDAEVLWMILACSAGLVSVSSYYVDSVFVLSAYLARANPDRSQGQISTP